MSPLDYYIIINILSMNVHNKVVLFAQIHQTQLEWELKPLQTTQVSECHGSGHPRVWLCVLILLQFTTNLREALWWWTIQQLPVPPCPTSSATQSTPSGFKPSVVELVKHLSSEPFFYHQKACTCYVTFYTVYCSYQYIYHPSPSHSHWSHYSVHECLKCQSIMAVD